MFDGKPRDSCQGIEGAERSYLTIERLRRLSLAARNSRICEQVSLTFHAFGAILLPPGHVAVRYGTTPQRGGRLLR
ncbi:hypothetical protein NPIL_423781 [Nephila pilipes]|uniref:Uncharacterized protein n=1 Tax=Nephila pilipes TaxID=299642 RepID=A0A8X6P5T0_NEPPI|nr:hypothetical protein NPIL_423781 [Nephila pilipes]